MCIFTMYYHRSSFHHCSIIDPRGADIGQIHSITHHKNSIECFGFVGLPLVTLLGVQTAKECMLKHIAQHGILGSMAEESVVSSSFSVTLQWRVN